MALLDKRYKELEGRFKRGEIQSGSKEEKQKNMGLIQSYDSLKSFPSDLKKGQLYIDDVNLTILVPVNEETFVPFHISTINNVSKSGEG
jgi:nucleosome binding factor SPN SPT16 subunit